MPPWGWLKTISVRTGGSCSVVQCFSNFLVCNPLLHLKISKETYEKEWVYVEKLLGMDGGEEVI